MRIIVTGLIGQYPLGGVAWDYLNYVLGFKALGHEVYYIEDTGLCPYVPKLGGLTDDPTYTVEYLKDLMERFDLSDQWAYHFPYPVPKWFGMPDAVRHEVIETADILLNISGTLSKPQNYRSCRTLVYLDSDPVFTQVKLANDQKDFRALVDFHDIHFSLGENLPGKTPDTGHRWIPTRPPVCLELWQNSIVPRPVFTTVMNWTSYKPLLHNGVAYEQKDIEFKKYIDLPSSVSPTILELAINAGKIRKTPRDLLTYRGWKLVNPDKVCPDADSYRSYIQHSQAEWSVAKGGYVTGQCGWFSCRSVCYLAAGRPVVVQDTGFSKLLKTKEGIISFQTLAEATKAINNVSKNYNYHAEIATQLAEEYFDAKSVLDDLITRAWN